MTNATLQFRDAESIVRLLRSGSVVGIPTDTLPGLACLPDHALRIWALKQRPAEKPLILMADSPTELMDCARSACRQDALDLASEYWPGPLTMVLPAIQDGVVQRLNPNGSTVGLRIPHCATTRDLLRRSGPLATSSANLSGAPSSLSAEDVASAFPELALLGPGPWPQPSGQASTVLEWLAPGRWRILRAGAVIPDGISTVP